MENKKTNADMILEFNKKLSKIVLDVPDGFKILNPYTGITGKQINKITNCFYKTFYNDNNKRKMILGSSPARRGSAITGVPYEDAEHLQNQTGIYIDNFYVNKSSSNFLYDVIEKYGGCKLFYKDFYMNFVCPLGIVRINSKGKEVNCNYYENKKLQANLYNFILETLKEQLKFNIDTSVCYCIGSGENYEFLKELNEKYNFFEKIIPLEHPRYIMQYNSKNRDYYFDKYLKCLNINTKKER